MTPENFKTLVKQISEAIAEMPLNNNMTRYLNGLFPPTAKLFKTIETACHEAIKAGWMCYQGEEGRKIGRIFESSPETHDFSIDVVLLTDTEGPFHIHPAGEILMIMPQDDTAKFDGRGAGWFVYGPGSAHKPTVTGGSALVLYLLPNGEIEFRK